MGAGRFYQSNNAPRKIAISIISLVMTAQPLLENSLNHRDVVMMLP
jgi:hypothetical protein